MKSRARCSRRVRRRRGRPGWDLRPLFHKWILLQHGLRASAFGTGGLSCVGVTLRLRRCSLARRRPRLRSCGHTAMPSAHAACRRATVAPRAMCGKLPIFRRPVRDARRLEPTSRFWRRAGAADAGDPEDRTSQQVSGARRSGILAGHVPQATASRHRGLGQRGSLGAGLRRNRGRRNRALEHGSLGSGRM